MALFLDTRGHTTLAIGICARCSCKFPRDELVADPNFPGLFVCPDDLDNLDPYRLPAREADILTVDQPRPDVALSASAVVPIYPQPIFGATQFGITQPWRVLSNYAVGDTVTPQNVNDPNVVLPQNWFLCIVAGRSGSQAPGWPGQAGVVLGQNILTTDLTEGLQQLLSDSGIVLITDDSSGDGSVTWLCMGAYVL